MKRVIWFAFVCGGSVAVGVADQQRVPESREMGGKKSVTTFFVTSRGVGRGGDLGGLAGADAHCQALAQAEGSGDHTWRAYLSVSADAGDTPNVHDMITGSRTDGTAFGPADDLTCRNWTSSSVGRGQVGHHDRKGQGTDVSSWNSAHASRGCGQADLASTGGAGLFYCFGID